MTQKQKQKPVSGQPGKPSDPRDVAQPGNEPRTPGGPSSDVRNPAPAPGIGRDPLVHPGDEQDITPDVIAGQGQPSKQGTTRHGEHAVADRPGTQAVSGQGNAKPK
jgi:hypothetical protein